MAFRQQPDTFFQCDKKQMDALTKMFKDLPDNLGRNALRASIRKSVKIVERSSRNILISEGRVSRGKLKNL